ncbi:hypothetical protein [Paraburkholderia sp. J11-2]|uniref:hypothetical protein n=1 Tax=Paraburkholderia sp. J11-2 TaxID=2805431 RepID=UPI002AB7D062|nr:hypothetical protein [Paraburkholderia sp. J11-2]
MGAPRWSKQEDADLSAIWAEKGNLKESLYLFEGRSYLALLDRASYLGLGRRPHPDRRGVAFAKAAVLCELEKKGPGSIPELHARTRLSKSVLARHFKPELAGTEYHVIDWLRRPQGGGFVPVFKFGPGENAVRPTPRTTTEQSRVQRLRDNAKRMVSGDRPKSMNPFAVAAGLVQAPTGTQGRVFAQPMDVEVWGQTREAA